MNIKIENISYLYPETELPVFQNLSLEIPEGVVSLVGQNGVGKSTLMLLAAGRLHPQNGDVFLLGKNTKELEDEEELNLMASFLYQNMEFDTDEKVGVLLEQVLQNGLHGAGRKDIFDDCIRVFELQKILNRDINKISKGEIQRAILAFSLLYGSKTVFMDEPVFAMQDYQKIAALEYLLEYGKKEKRSIYYSAHELELTKKYSELVILFTKKPFEIEIGKPQDILTPEKLEKAYGVPHALLNQKEALHRKHLEEMDWLAKSKDESELPG